jgi:hypothetical protein
VFRCLLWLLEGGDLVLLQAVVMFWERNTVLGGLQEVRRLRLGSNGGVSFSPRSLQLVGCVLSENVWCGCQMPGEATQGGNAAGERECEADGSEQVVDGGERAAGEAHFAAGPGESDPSATATEPGVR